MEINSFVVIDDNLESRIAFGIANGMAGEGIEYYPFTHVDEALTIPNALIQEAPDMIFLNLDMAFNNGEDNIRKLKNVDQLKDVPIIVYSDFEIDTVRIHDLGASHCFHKPEKVKALVKVISPILKGDALPLCLCDRKYNARYGGL